MLQARLTADKVVSYIDHSCHISKGATIVVYYSYLLYHNHHHHSSSWAAKVPKRHKMTNLIVWYFKRPFKILYYAKVVIFATLQKP